MHRSAGSLGLTSEQARVLERYYALFRRAGAGLDAAAKERLKEIGDRLASLGTSFGQNVLADELSYVLPLGADGLDGLPEFARAAARGAAEERGMSGHAVTLSRSLSCSKMMFARLGQRFKPSTSRSKSPSHEGVGGRAPRSLR